VSVERDVAKLRALYGSNGEGWRVGSRDGDMALGLPAGGHCLDDGLRAVGASSETRRAIERRVGKIPRWNDRQSWGAVSRLLDELEPEPRRGVTPQKPAEKPAKIKVEKPTRPGRQRTGAAPWKVWGVALVAVFLLGVVVRVARTAAAALAEAGRAVVETVHAVNTIAADLAPWVAVVSTLTLLGAHIDWRHVHAWHGRRVRYRRELLERRAAWQALVEVDRAPIALGSAELVEVDQEWIEKGLRRAWFDDHNFEPVRREKP
jgi:hypothetical protein